MAKLKYSVRQIKEESGISKLGYFAAAALTGLNARSSTTSPTMLKRNVRLAISQAKYMVSQLTDKLNEEEILKKEEYELSELTPET